MNSASVISKKAAVDPKYLKAAIMAAVATAGIGAVARNIKAKKARRKALDVASAPNTIVIPIKKTKFMEGLPTPAEFAALHPDKVDNASAAPAADATKTPAPENTGGALSPEAVAAKKKDILRGRERCVDFFGKRAEETAVKQEEKKTVEAPAASESETKNAPENEGKGDKKDNGTPLFRDQAGRFVSPTDPTAVQQEKKAYDGWDALKEIGNIMIHPIDSGKIVLNAAMDHPVKATVGMLGSIYLASKIADAINERRRAKSKNLLDSAREKYVSELEGAEKKAQDGETLRKGFGMLWGGTLMVPMAISALVTNRIIENRKLEKQKKKEESNSYPDEPVFIYKTSEAKEIPMSAETALGMILVKSAMIANIEREEGMLKAAGPFGDAWNKVKATGKDLLKKHTGYDTATPDSAMDTAVEYLNDPKNSGLMLDYIMANGPTGTSEQRQSAYSALTNGLATGENAWKGNAKYWMDPSFKGKLMSDPRIYDTLAHRFSNDPKYIEYRDKMIDRELGKTFQEGSILHKIVSWFMKTFGIGASRFNDQLRQRIGSLAGNVNAPVPAPAATATGAASTGVSAPAPVATGAAPKVPAPSANDPKYGNGKAGVEQWNKDFNAWRNQI